MTNSKEHGIIMKKSIKTNQNAKHRPNTWDDKIQLNDLTIEDCEKLYQSGYYVVVDDGQVVDLKKFK